MSTQKASAEFSKLIARRWKLVVILVWLALCCWMLLDKSTDIHSFNLSDTDDNMRIMQVRGLLQGQGWYDLRQHRLNPPVGINIHWSRVVDLPLATLIIGLRPLVGGVAAEQWAVALAPLLPYLLLMLSVALAARRLIDASAYPLALIALVFASRTNLMFLPERIDHHGWQLAFVALGVAGLTDPKKVRGGLTLGIAISMSLAIGLEMLIYLAILGGAKVLAWVVDCNERDGLRIFAASLSGTIAAGFVLFASYDNRLPVCDALSPVWLSDVLLAGGLIYAIAWISPKDWRKRTALAAATAVVVAGFHATVWPDCLQRLEGLSTEANRLWLSYVNEARPIYVFRRRYVLMSVALPLTGLGGWALLAWLRRADPPQLIRVLGAGATALAATLLLLWQNRAGPASQMLATPGAAAFTWVLMPLAWRCRFKLARAVGAVSIAAFGSGAATPFLLDVVATKKPQQVATQQAFARCNSISAMMPVGLQPKGVVFAPIDLAPRLITVTHHDAITGPYHRNAEEIADVMLFFRGDADQAHRLILKYHSNYVLTCPVVTGRTFGLARVPNSFFAKLENGNAPGWLVPIELPKNSPFKMWRVVRNDHRTTSQRVG